MKRLIALGLVGMLGCADDGNDTGRLEGSGTPGSSGSTRIDQLEVAKSFLNDGLGPIFLIDYTGKEDNLSIEVNNNYFEGAGSYDDSSNSLNIYEGEHNITDGIWYLHSDLSLESGVNTNLNDNVCGDFNTMFQKGTAVICENQYTELDNLSGDEICMVNGAYAPDSFINLD